MRTIKNEKKKELITKVRSLKKTLKDSGMKDIKSKFFDEMYGKLFKKESMKLDNVWDCLTADETFVNKLQKFTDKYV